MSSTRPTKKQKELLTYIHAFIVEHGYSPSYREIMNGVGYTSVATVALHVNNLIKRGHLQKRDNEARSLEPTANMPDPATAHIQKNDAAWLFEHIEQRLKQLEQRIDAALLDDMYVLIGSVKVLGFYDQAVAYITRLKKLEADAQ
jgi:SOS-response transcriptional repressor LexA